MNKAEHSLRTKIGMAHQALLNRDAELDGILEALRVCVKRKSAGIPFGLDAPPEVYFDKAMKKAAETEKTSRRLRKLRVRLTKMIKKQAERDALNGFTATGEVS